ncbi:MAG: flavoprotein [Actinomycetes bacterium]
MAPSLALVVCGAPLAVRTPDTGRALIEAGWAVTVVATEAASPWLDTGAIRSAVGQSPRTAYRTPDQPKPPRSAAVVACPATFNTINKLAAGLADNYATSLLCESLGAAVPLVVVPMVNEYLWGHPAWAQHLTRLANSGATFLDVQTGEREPRAVPSGSGDQVVEAFDPGWVTNALPSPDTLPSH